MGVIGEEDVAIEDTGDYEEEVKEPTMAKNKGYNKRTEKYWIELIFPFFVPNIFLNGQKYFFQSKFSYTSNFNIDHSMTIQT